MQNKILKKYLFFFISIIKNIQTHLDDSKYVAGVFVDLKNASDTVDHDILIIKMEGH